MRWDSEDCKRFFSFSSSVSFITHSAYDLVPPPAAATSAFARTKLVGEAAFMQSVTWKTACEEFCGETLLLHT